MSGSSSDPGTPIGEATLLLGRLTEGDLAAAEDLLPLVYAELRARAGAYFRGQPANHTLQPTALVHEAYVKLVGSPAEGWRGRSHFCAVAATAMRQILINHAHKRAATQRAREARAGMGTQIPMPSEDAAVDLIALDEALTKLGGLDERDARLVELRFFGGLTNEEIADVLGVSESTIKKDWRRVRAWLRHELSGEKPA